MRQRYRTARAIKHHEALAEIERTYKLAIDNDLTAPAAQQPPPPLQVLPVAEDSSLPTVEESPQAQMPRPPHNRRLEFNAQLNLPAMAEPAQQPLPPPAAAPPSQPDPAPRAVQGSQPGMTQLLHDKVGDWRQRCASSEVAEAPPDKYPTSPDAPDDDGLPLYSDSLCESGQRYAANYKPPKPSPQTKSKPVTVCYRNQLWVRKDHRDPRGLAPLCYVATDYEGPPDPDGNYHQGYLCYDKRDLDWARRLRFHLHRLQ